MAGPRIDLRRSLHRLAFGQAGYFTAAQAVELGYSYQAQKHHVDSGNWMRVDRGLFRLPDWPPDADDAWVRWTLWSRGLGVVSHDSALAVHGLSDADPALIHLTVPPGFRARDEHLALHVAPLAESDVERRSGWSVTTPLRTLLDVAGGDTSQETVDQALSDALAMGLVTRRRILRATADAPDRAALRLERALTRVDEHG